MKKREKRGKRSLVAFFNNQRIGVKLLLAFVLASVIPILLVQVLSYNMNLRNMRSKIDELMTSSLEQISEQVSLSLNAYYGLVYQVRNDETILDNLKLLAGTGQEHAAAYNEINGRLRHYQSTAAGIRSISIICPNGKAVVYDVETDSAVENIWRGYDDLREIEPYLLAMEANPGIALTATTRFAQTRGEALLFHISRTVFDVNSLNVNAPVAVVVLSLEEPAVLGSLCNSKTDGSENSINFILDSENNVISYPDSAFAGTRLESQPSIEDFVQSTGFMEGKTIGLNQFVSDEQQLPEAGWIYYNAYDTDYMLQDLRTQQSFFWLVGTLALAFSILLILSTTRSITKSVREVTTGIQEMRDGNLDVVVPVTSRDEIGEIAENFNEMSQKVKQSIEDVKVAAEKQRKAEIRSLEAQINPHFMYNTLDTINWMAIDKDEHEISRALRDFGVILRYSITKSDRRVAIWEVADWIDKYVSLNQLRFVGVFDYLLTLDASVREEKMHKLLLQPFVENAILHGFRGVQRGGMLRIDIAPSEDERSVVIIIEDNGKGISPELAQQFNEMESTGKDLDSGIGIANVFGRLRMYYGDKAHWNVSSIKGMGTIVTLVIPTEKGEMEDADTDCGG